MLSDDIVSACARPEFVARFWSKVDKSGECWVWTGPHLPHGYGTIGVARRNGNAVTGSTHRVAWTLANGRIPDGTCVCHRCDNPSCVRPDHLFIGTQVENLADMRAKGRHQRGESSSLSKLTEAQVREIRALRGTVFQKEIAARFGISQTQVHRILSGKRWAHV